VAEGNKSGRDVDELWAKLREGEPEVDENVLITSATVNQQTADRMAALSGAEENSKNTTQPKEENMSATAPSALKEFDSLDELKDAAFKLGELHFKMENELTVPFMQYYAKYYRIVEGIPKPEEGTSTLFDLVSVNDEYALFVVHGYTETTQEVNPNPTPHEDPDHEPEDYFLETTVHTRERFVSFPLDFFEKKDEYFQKAEAFKADKLEKDAKAAKKAATAELKELKCRKKELEATIKDAEKKLKQ